MFVFLFSIFFYLLSCEGVQTPGHFREFDAHTPTSSGRPALSYEDDLAMQCSCHMKITEEEDKLYAHTLAVSYVQDGLPLVPHLSFSEEDVDIVRVQNEVRLILYACLSVYNIYCSCHRTPIFNVNIERINNGARELRSDSELFQLATKLEIYSPEL